MSWLYSRALVAEYLADTCSAGALSALSSGSHTPRAFLPPDRMTAFSRPSRFGMTFGPLMGTLGAELLTWFLVASRAKTSALPEKAQELTEPAAECGAAWRGSWAKFDRASSLWKIAQPCLLGDSDESLVTWPRSGMTAAGQCWELPMLAPPTSVTGSGLLLPTPTAAGFECQDVPRLLARRAKYAEKYGNNGFGLTLNQWVKFNPVWRTPSASVVEPKSNVVKLTGRKSTDPQVGLADQVGGSLSPTWVEWLMRWPLGWTDLKPLAMGKCLCVQQQHGGF